MAFKDQFKIVFGRDMTTEEEADYYKYTSELGIKKNDALLTFFLFQQHNLALLSQIPATLEQTGAQIAEKIKLSGDQTVDTVRRRSTLAFKDAAEGIAEQLMNLIHHKIEKISDKKTQSVFSKTVSIAIVVSLVCLLAAGYVGYTIGFNDGNKNQTQTRR